MGKPYWDGGYVGNPALYPLVGATETENLLLVQINPLQRKQVPKTHDEIMARINEITFNSSLMSELRGITFVGKLIDEGKLPRGTGSRAISEDQFPSYRPHGLGADPGYRQPAEYRL